MNIDVFNRFDLIDKVCVIPVVGTISGLTFVALKSLNNLGLKLPVSLSETLKAHSFSRLLIGLIPLVGTIFLIVFPTFLPSSIGGKKATIAPKPPKASDTTPASTRPSSPKNPLTDISLSPILRAGSEDASFASSLDFSLNIHAPMPARAPFPPLPNSRHNSFDDVSGHATPNSLASISRRSSFDDTLFSSPNAEDA
jgi:hypothetical protein